MRKKTTAMAGFGDSDSDAQLVVPRIIAAQVSPARSPAVAARVGIALGAAITVCFVTGLLSHWIQHPPSWFWWPPRPVWLYRVTQGAHVLSGVTAIPLLLVKLWSVYPRLFAKPLIGGPIRALERGSIAVLVGAVMFQLATGLFNTAQWYPWKFFFTTTHYAIAYVAFGAVAVHLAVKLPVVRAAVSRPVTGTADTDRGPSPTAAPADRERHAGMSRRAVLGIAGITAAVAGLATAGQTIRFLRWLSVLAPRTGQGPQGVPVNRTAAQAGVTALVFDPAYRLHVTVGSRQRAFTVADLRALPQSEAALPIACVEGWSASARWTGVRLLDLLTVVGGYPGGSIRFTSLEQSGLYRVSVLPPSHVVDPDSLIALRLNGQELDIDHGYPCRLIAPSRPGVLQTKWLSSIEVLA
ncbi:molybdopterin-dependent oxidoreductase [Nocardia sp. NBC_00881]|uniref:molybdopterin-dependent oxidoreductase n=1 Tax=Nocardia sp. NBC_00881 TaxID=2975995 RepID=UPI00386C2D38|nr:molybdopterin-dependent oxidoreductase [Nocardia sp. NBC_00881]